MCGAYANFKVQPDAKNFFRPRLNFFNPPASCNPTKQPPEKAPFWVSSARSERGWVYCSLQWCGVGFMRGSPPRFWNHRRRLRYLLPSPLGLASITHLTPLPFPFPLPLHHPPFFSITGDRKVPTPLTSKPPRTAHLKSQSQNSDSDSQPYALSQRPREKGRMALPRWYST